MLSNIIGPLPNTSVAQGEKVEKLSGYLNDIKDPVVTIRQQYLDNKKEKDNTKRYHFQGKSTRAKGLFDIDHEWSEEKFCTREPYFYTKIYKINIEVQEIETCQIFLVPQASVLSNKP